MFYYKRTLNKLYIDNDGKMLMMDIVIRLLEIERECNNFQKHGAQSIYGNTLDLMRRSDTSEFCAISDSYNYSQTLRKIDFEISEINQ